LKPKTTKNLVVSQQELDIKWISKNIKVLGSTEKADVTSEQQQFPCILELVSSPRLSILDGCATECQLESGAGAQAA
jgi:hypothetical protein